MTTRFVRRRALADTRAAVAPRARVQLIVPSLVVLASALWLFSLTQRSVWIDELNTVAAIHEPSFGAMLAMVSIFEFRPPLYFLMLRAWTLVAGDAEFTLRFFSWFFAVAALPLAYQVAHALSGRRLGWLAALLMLTSPTLALYGVMVRYYSLMLFLGLALLLATQRLRAGALRDVGASSRWFWLWAIAALAALYTDYMLGAFTLALSLALGWDWRRSPRDLRRWLMLNAALGLLFLPWVANAVQHALTEKVEADLATGSLSLALKIVYPFFSFTLGETIFPWHPLALIAALPIARLLWRGARTLLVRAPWMAMAFTAAFALAVITFSTVAKDHPFVNLPARVLFLLPCVLIALALGAQRLPARGAALALLAIVAAQAAALYNLSDGAQYHNPIYAVPMRQVSASLARAAQPGDLVIADADTAFSYYWQAQPPRGVQFLLGSQTSEIERALLTARPPHVWLLVFGRDRTLAQDNTPAIERALADAYLLRETRGYVPIDPLYLAFKSRLIGREAYEHKLTVRRYERRP